MIIKMFAMIIVAEVRGIIQLPNALFQKSAKYKKIFRFNSLNLKENHAESWTYVYFLLKKYLTSDSAHV